MSLPRSPWKQFVPFTSSGRKRFCRRVAGVAVSTAAILLPHASYGLIWDITPGDGPAITPGSGAWSLEAGNWNDGAGTDALWTNGGVATFAGADAVAPETYNITVGSGLSAQSVVFSNSGYVLNAAAPTTLGLATTSSINVVAGKSATIGSNLTLERGGEITIGGGGFLTLAGTVQTTTTTNMAVAGGTTVEVLAGGQMSSRASLVLGPVSGTGTDGTLRVSGGAVRVTNNLVVGNVGGVNGSLKITDGLVALDPATGNGLRYGPSAALTAGAITGTVDLDGGILETRWIAEGPSSGAGSITSTFNFNGGLLRATITHGGSFMNGLDFANVKAGGARIDTNGFNASIPQVLSHDAGTVEPDGGLTKIGEGVLTLSGANTFNGPVKILGGTISVATLSTGANPLGLSSNASSNLLLDGGTFRFAGTGNLASERGFTLGERGGTIELAHTAGNVGFRFGGVVTGSGNLTVTRGNNNGGLFFGLSADNTYTGKTFVTNGAILEYRRDTAAGAGGSFESGTEVTGATVKLDPNGSNGAQSDQTYTEYFTLGEGGTLENRARSNTVTGKLALTGNGNVTANPAAGVLTLAGEVMLNSHSLNVSPSDSGIAIIGGISGGPEGSLVKTGSGPLFIFGDSNSYTGITKVDAGALIVDGTLSGTSGIAITGGTLELAAANRINDQAALTMTGGTLLTAGVSEEMGKFTLQGTATIDLGAGASVLRFRDSSDGAANWNGALTIANWTGSLTGGGTDQLFFGTTGGGLTSSQLAMITFLDPAGFEPGSYGAQMLPTGEVVAAVPEPGTLAALIGGIGVLGLGRFRRRFRG